MSKSVKDITSWEGGVSNAIEPADAGDDSKTTAVLKNLDGTTKKGVLRPAGSMIDFDTRLSGFNIAATEYPDLTQITFTVRMPVMSDESRVA